MLTEEQAMDLVDQWHLRYEGELPLTEYMMKYADWSLMDTEYYLVTGKIVNG